MNPFFENREKARQPFESFESENMEFPEHLHNHTEILMVCSGQITVRIMEEVRELQEGDCAFIFPSRFTAITALRRAGFVCIFLTVLWQAPIFIPWEKPCPAGHLFPGESCPETAYWPWNGCMHSPAAALFPGTPRFAPPGFRYCFPWSGPGLRSRRGSCPGT